MSQPLRIVVGVAIILAVGIWRVSDGGTASATSIAIFVVVFLGAVVGSTLWNRRKNRERRGAGNA